MYAVRYYSRSGNTKVLAEAIAKAAGTEAASVDAKNAAITEPVDVLFVGGALYAYGLDKHLKAWLSELDGTKVKKAVVFSTSWISKHSVDLIRSALQAKGIDVADESIYAKNKPTAENIKAAETIVKKAIS